MIDIQNLGMVPAEDAVKFLDEHALLRAEDIKILTQELLKDGTKNAQLTEVSFAELLKKLKWDFAADSSEEIDTGGRKSFKIIQDGNESFGDVRKMMGRRRQKKK